MQKHCFFTLLVLSLLCFPSVTRADGGGQQAPAELDLYLCIGQSNMAGRGTLTAEVMDTLQGVWLLNAEGRFEPAVNPLNRYSNIRKEMPMQRMGPAYSFAKQMARLTRRPVGLVVNARGGSSIRAWMKGSEEGYYEQTLERVRAAIRQGGRLRAILWHQGEADCAYPESYRTRLVQLMTDLRTDLGMPQLPVVVGQISRWNWTKRPEGTRPFNDLIERVSDFLPHATFVSSEGLQPYLDETDPHFDTPSQLLLGERYVQALRSLIE